MALCLHIMCDRLLGLLLLLVACAVPMVARAQDAHFVQVPASAVAASSPTGSAASATATTPVLTEERKPNTYSLGLRLRVAGGGSSGTTTKLRPTLGLRYGRWRLGTSTDMDSWLAFGTFRREPTLAYDFGKTDKLSTTLSLRLHNISTNEGFDAFETGRHTLRARVMFGYALSPEWSAGLELTQDLLDRGDGTTVGLGLSRGFALSDHSLLTASAGITWGSGTHWRTPYINNPLLPPEGSGLGAGFGNLGLGLTYRHAMGPHWAWYTNLGTSRAIGQVSQVAGSRWGVSAQLGLMYFGKF